MNILKRILNKKESNEKEDVINTKENTDKKDEEEIKRQIRLNKEKKELEKKINIIKELKNIESNGNIQLTYENFFELVSYKKVKQIQRLLEAIRRR